MLLYELYNKFSLKLSEFCNDENVVLSYEFKLFDELYEFTKLIEFNEDKEFPLKMKLLL